jgi:hypothetical protein
MLVAQFGLNGVMASYSYRQDGRISGLTSSDAKLNRTFGYDDFGRISSSVGGGGPEPEQFTQSYGYDVFNNFTARSGRYWWVNGNQSYTAGWVNGRMVSAAENNTTLSTEYTKSGQMIRSWYLNQGNQVTKDGPFRYDAAGRVAGEGAVSASNPEQTMFYDGDGRMVKDLRNSTTTCSVRSSALGGEILTLLNASGQKDQTHVYAGGSLIATQTVSSYGNTITPWRRDPHKALSFGGSGSSPQMLDPLNVSVSPATATQIQQYFQGQYQPPGGYGNPNGVGYGPPPSVSSGTTCKADGGPIPCSMVLNWRNYAWVKEARVINNLGGVGSLQPGEWRKVPKWTDIPTGNPLQITARDDSYFEWVSGGLVEQGVQETPDDVITNTVKDALKLLRSDTPQRKKCRDAINYGDYIDASTGTMIKGNDDDAASLLERLHKKGNLKHGNVSDTQGAAASTSPIPGDWATITFDDDWFINSKTAVVVQTTIDLEKTQMKVDLRRGRLHTLLHELAHATGRYSHSWYQALILRYKGVKSQEELNQIIYDNCIKGYYPDKETKISQ